LTSIAGQAGQAGQGSASRDTWAVVAAAWLVALFALVTWVVTTPSPVLREQLARLQFWSLEACVFLGLALAAAVASDLRRAIDRRDLVRMSLLAALALALVAGLAPRTNRIFYDEQIYQNIGQNLADSKRAQMCNDGAVRDGRLQCARYEYNKQPYAYPHVLSLFYRLFGARTSTAFAVNAAAMTLTVCAVYLIVVVLFSDRTAALFAALLLALTPEQLVWSATAASEPSASLAAAGALLAAACFVRWRSNVSLAGAAVAAAYAVQFRPESLLIVPVILLLIYQRAREECSRPRLWWAGVLFLALVAVDAAHMVAVRNEGWGTSDERFSLGYVAGNLRVNGWFYLADWRFPPVDTVLALIGLTAWRGEKGRLTVASYFVLFFGIALLFYAGSYDYGADVRYSLATYPPIAILGGLGAARLVATLKRLKPTLPATTLLATALGLLFVWIYAPAVRRVGDSAWAARADEEFARALAPALRDDAYVLTHNPGMFHLWGVNAGQLSLAGLNPAFLDELAARFSGGIDLHWNFWCNVDDRVQRELCTKVLGLRPVELIRDHHERDQYFAVYRLARTPATSKDR
jgi:Dolichyl-phosphate-mannose-protein mannosyltransferase